MTDNSRKTPAPPPLEERRLARQKSQDERDAESFAALKEREATSRLTPEFLTEEITGRYEGDALAEQRERRPTPDRVKRLEKKHDELRADVEKKHDELKVDFRETQKDVKVLSGHVSDLRADVAGAVGKIDGQEKVMTEMLSIVKEGATRDHVTFTAKVEVDKERELAKVEVDKEQLLDTFHARRARRRMIVKAVGVAASGAGLIELLHRLGVL